MSITSERYHCEIGRIHFKRHRSREKRKDAVSIIRAQIALHDKLRAELAARRFRELEPIMFAGMAGKGA